MLKDKLKNFSLVLASGSPRRQQFFKDLDMDFSIRVIEIEEIFPPDLKREEITNYLAMLKASAHLKSIQENEIVVTSDTIVWHNKEALGKPKNYDDAFQMLKKLSNTTHEVVTSVCFFTTQSRNILHDVTEVTFKELTDEMIHYYIENYKPYDKAGAYGIQEWIGFIGVQSVKGSYANVMGLPTHKVFAYLNGL